MAHDRHVAASAAPVGLFRAFAQTRLNIRYALTTFNAMMAKTAGPNRGMAIPYTCRYGAVLLTTVVLLAFLLTSRSVVMNTSTKAFEAAKTITRTTVITVIEGLVS